MALEVFVANSGLMLETLAQTTRRVTAQTTRILEQIHTFFCRLLSPFWEITSHLLLSPGRDWTSIYGMDWSRLTHQTTRLGMPSSDMLLSRNDVQDLNLSRVENHE